MTSTKVIAFVPVRLTSSRLPRKHLRMIGSRTLLSWVIYRLKQANTIDQIVVCSPDEPASQELKAICKEENVDLYLYQGEVNDVVGRLTAAAKTYDAEICVLASGDCPLLEGQSIDKLVNLLLDNRQAMQAGFDLMEGAIPIHEGIMVVRRKLWEAADKLSITPEQREHFFPVLFQNASAFVDYLSVFVRDEDIYYRHRHRLSIDTPADLQFHSEVFDRLQQNGHDYILKNAISLFGLEPQLLDINKQVYQKQVEDQTKKAVFFVGYARNERTLELDEVLFLAHELVHRKGTGVTFMVANKSLSEAFENQHYSAVVLDIEDHIPENLLTEFSVIYHDFDDENIQQKLDEMATKISGLRLVPLLTKRD